MQKSTQLQIIRINELALAPTSIAAGWRLSTVIAGPLAKPASHENPMAARRVGRRPAGKDRRTGFYSF
jgi:hypothetical protein